MRLTKSEIQHLKKWKMFNPKQSINSKKVLPSSKPQKLPIEKAAETLSRMLEPPYFYSENQEPDPMTYEQTVITNAFGLNVTRQEWQEWLVENGII